MPAAIPAIRRYEFGRDLGLGGDTLASALVADLDDTDAYHAYSAHPDHLELIRTLVAPSSKRRCDVQYEVG